MNEESPQSCPPSNDKLNEIDILFNHIKLELQKEGITAQLGWDISNKNLTVTTDKKVPEEIMLRLSESPENKGYTIKFLPHD